MTILSVHPSFNPNSAFALKLRPTDSPETLHQRCVTKLNLPASVNSKLSVSYEWLGVYYVLADEEDWDIFLDRAGTRREMTLMVEAPKDAVPATVKQQDTPSPGVDSASIYSTSTTKKSRDVSLHVVQSSIYSGNATIVDRGGSVRSDVSGHSARSKGSRKSKKDAEATEPLQPKHKTDFANWQNQLSVRTVVGSIGPVQNVRMMIKPGHRYVYMSRQFALTHGFIPKDAAPGFYGYTGITNLGKWNVQVGEKAVQQEVQLVENSYFPVILGRAFMERRGVKTSPLEPTIRFLDTGETIQTDLVIVKDAEGEVLSVS